MLKGSDYLWCRWDEDFELLVHEPEHQQLSLVLYEHHALDKDDEVGRVSVPISNLEVGQLQDLWLDLGPPGDQESSSLLSLSVRACRGNSSFSVYKACKWGQVLYCVCSVRHP